MISKLEDSPHSFDQIVASNIVKVLRLKHRARSSGRQPVREPLPWACRAWRLRMRTMRHRVGEKRLPSVWSERLKMVSVQGAALDGLAGSCGVARDRRFAVIALLWRVIQVGFATPHLLHEVIGFVASCLQYRGAAAVDLLRSPQGATRAPARACQIDSRNAQGAGLCLGCVV